MERKDGISIIVPCYNVEKYLKTCVDSLLNQQIDNYEILLIDDGSTDKTGKLCDEYKKNKKIKVFHKKNGGLCDARNYGIDRATYKYLTFVDSDDWVTEDYVSTIYSKMEEGYDLIIFDAYEVLDGAKEGNHRGCYFAEKQTKEDFILRSTEPSFAWARCYDYKLFDIVKYPNPSIWYEDVATTPILTSYAKNIAHISKNLYFYRQREGSISHVSKNPKILGILEACERSLTLGNKEYIKELEYAVYHILVEFLHFRPEYAEEYLEYANKYKERFLENQYILNEIESGRKENIYNQKLIPKKIHYFWFGGNPLNDLTKRCIETWKKYAPDYEIIEWNESNCDVYENDYVKEAYENKKWAFVADYFRIKVIYEQGGFYMDTDMELTNNIDFLRLNNIFFPAETNNVNACIFGAIDHHPIVEEWLRGYQTDHFVKEDGTLDIDTTIVVRLTRVLKKYYKIKYDGYSHKIAPYFTIYSPDVLLVDVFNNQNVSLHHYDATWWDVRVGMRSYKYDVLNYYFKHKKEKKEKLSFRIKRVILNTVRKVASVIFPQSVYDKGKRAYRKIKGKSM